MKLIFPILVFLLPSADVFADATNNQVDPYLQIKPYISLTCPIFDFEYPNGPTAPVKAQLFLSTPDSLGAVAIGEIENKQHLAGVQLVIDGKDIILQSTSAPGNEFVVGHSKTDIVAYRNTRPECIYQDAEHNGHETRYLDLQDTDDLTLSVVETKNTCEQVATLTWGASENVDFADGAVALNRGDEVRIFRPYRIKTLVLHRGNEASVPFLYKDYLHKHHLGFTKNESCMSYLDSLKREAR